MMNAFALPLHVLLTFAEPSAIASEAPANATTTVQDGAFAASEVSVRRNERRAIEVVGPRITLGHVLPTAPRELLGLDIGPAPAPSKSTIVTRAAVSAALRRAGADEALANGLPARQEVARQGYRLSVDELSRRLRESVATKLPLGVRIDRIIGVEEQILSVGDMDVDVRLGRLAQSTTASVSLSVGGRVEARFTATLLLSGQPQMPTLRHDMPRGATITATDVALVDGEFTDLPTRSVLQPVELVGKRLTQPGFSGKPVQRAAVAEPPVIERGAQVSVIAIRPGLRITQLGTAQEAGAMGDLIRIQTETTVLRARVEGPGEVHIVLGGGR